MHFVDYFKFLTLKICTQVPLSIFLPKIALVKFKILRYFLGAKKGKTKSFPFFFMNLLNNQAP